MNLAFVGFGAVARRFVEMAFLDRPTPLPTGCQIVGIATGRHGYAVDAHGIDPAHALQVSRNGTGDLRPLHDPAATDDAPASTLAFLTAVRSVSDDDLVVVETTPLGLDGGRPGVDHVEHALSNRASVITANKGPAAFAGRALQDLARRTGQVFRCEGAVLDGLPVFSLLRHSLPGVRVLGFRGIVNTTTNHVLTRMESGLSLEDAVREMQAAGITEADPSHDIEGWDAAAKTAVLANLLMNADLSPHDVERQSLRTIDPDAIRWAHDHGQRIKFVASARAENGIVVGSVCPVALDADDPLAGLHGTAKGLELQTDRLGPIVLSKRRSGLDHTAYALLCDLVEVSRLRTGPPGQIES